MIGVCEIRVADTLVMQTDGVAMLHLPSGYGSGGDVAYFLVCGHVWMRVVAM